MNTVATKPSINLQEIQNAILPAEKAYLARLKEIDEQGE